ncbi:MAG: PAS domain-containing sensor histidine kinase [Pseudomonadota bacterium]|nr:PAS domain-containing sensor histidine kinase [Pseudomonadota bacterium]
MGGKISSNPATVEPAERESAKADATAGAATAAPSLFLPGLIIVVLSLLSGLATYVILTGLTPIVPTHKVVVTALLINGLMALAMIALIAWQITGLWLARRRQAAAARLHVRIVGLFSIIAVLPAILLAVFATVSLARGLDYWFSTRTKTIIQNSITVANAYLREHGQVIRADAVSMAADIDEAVALVRTQPESFGQFLRAQASIRSIPLAYLIDNDRNLLASAGGTDGSYEPPPAEAIEAAKDGTATVIAPGQTNKVGAVKRLNKFANTYLYIVRRVDPLVLQHLRATQASVQEYQTLDKRRTGVQVAFALMYIAVALTLLLASIWIGLWFANRLVSPIRRLIAAAKQVSEGTLDTQVAITSSEGDLAQLGRTFNDMTAELRTQRNELMDANQMLDERRRFIEVVLSGVTAGVIGLNAKGVITLANPSAEALLGTRRKQMTGKSIEEAVPEFAVLFRKARKQSPKPVQDQIHLIRNAAECDLAVRVTSESTDAKAYGYVITFDDITELVAAQRTSAWADIARRIAHEIKNPLTPIQLSAERIRRKYGSAITKDREIFDQCTDTIIRQVGDIGRMVDEFSAFARMPKPVMTRNDMRDIVREAVFLFQVSHPGMTFTLDLPEGEMITMCDRSLMSQAITNLVKNATEAIEGVHPQTGDGEQGTGRIDVSLRAKSGRIILEVIDNGPGFPQVNRNRLVEPYMTTREKGTGLGLAIVQKITEQHGGRLLLNDAPKRDGDGGGACVRLDLPITVDVPTALAEDAGEKRSGDKSKTAAKEKEGAEHGV